MEITSVRLAGNGSCIKRSDAMKIFPIPIFLNRNFDCWFKFRTSKCVFCRFLNIIIDPFRKILIVM